MRPEFYWLAVAFTTVVSAARFTRLATVDKFPPVKWLREKHQDWTDGSDWQWLTLCGYCFSFWATAFVVVWGWLSGVYDVSGNGLAFTIWWAFNGTFAASYLAAVFMANDGADGEDD